MKESLNVNHNHSVDRVARNRLARPPPPHDAQPKYEIHDSQDGRACANDDDQPPAVADQPIDRPANVSLRICVRVRAWHEAGR